MIREREIVVRAELGGMWRKVSPERVARGVRLGKGEWLGGVSSG